MTFKSKAETFRSLHSGSRILVLPNAWDVASARIVEAAGAQAIATTSAGIANALGYADGQRIPRNLMMEAARRIVRSVDLPVTVDAEAGYGQGPEDAAETAQQVIAAGAVGMNLEDGTGDPSDPLFEVEQQVARIRAVRGEAGNDAPLLLNARIDVFLAAVGRPETRIQEAVRRASAYRDAGADCLFVPGVTDAKVISELVHAIKGPLNVLAGPGTPPVAELERIGVARVSTGSAFMRACFAKARDVARDILDSGAWESLLDKSISYAEMNALAAERNVQNS